MTALERANKVLREIEMAEQAGKAGELTAAVKIADAIDRAVGDGASILQHERALIIDALEGEGETDCSTPLHQRVRNVITELRALRSSLPFSSKTIDDSSQFRR